MPLLDEIRGLADNLGPSDLPSPGETQHLLGGLVKVLEHQGVSVPDELLAEHEPEPVAPPAGAEPPVSPSLIARLERALSKLEGHDAPPEPDTPPEPDAEPDTPPPGPEPYAPPAPDAPPPA